MTAAVADYRPAAVSEEKIKKSDDEMIIKMIKNPDILASMGKVKSENQLLIGFALETNQGKYFAQEKLQKKNADFIVLNSLKDQGAGFGHDTNKVSIVDAVSSEDWPLMSKEQVAKQLVLRCLKTIQEKRKLC
jgi:phosphopantothenoylcysteine decarboxylase/phosphopantothenate--cysteine ligase